jgi:CheY-like chemotaxis protein
MRTLGQSGEGGDLEVLVVDDDPVTLALVAEALMQRGWRVRVAGSVMAAREALADARPDVLISDVDMPVEDGYDLIRDVRRLGKPAGDVPAIAFTAHLRPEDCEHALACGFDAVVQKPLDPGALAAAVRQAAGTVGREPEVTPAPDSPARDS